MTEQTTNTTAKVRPVRQWSPIWIVPVVVLLIGGWMLYHNYQQQGPLVTLITEDAEGLVAGKTPVKNRSVDVGQVVSVDLSDDLKQVIVKARMKPAVAPLLNDGSLFWVVKPQISRAGISGLNTLLSGVYIELQPGDSDKSKLEYTLLPNLPVAPADAPGVRVRLLSGETAGLNVGDPVLYRGYEVGIVELREFDIEKRRTEFQLYIREPYNALVTDNVRFWSSSGLSFGLSADGVQVDVAPAAALLSGGVNFDLLDGWQPGNAAQNGTEFILFADKSSIQDGMYNQYVEYLVFFDESVRGLKSGAPVEYQGIRVGTVSRVPYFFAMDKPFEVSLRQGIPVLVRIEAGRLYENVTVDQLRKELDKAIGGGLKAVLKSGNLLTGALYIDLKISKDSPATDAEQLQAEAEMAELSKLAGYPVLPSARSGLSDIEQKVLLALDKITNLPVEQFLQQGLQTLERTEQLMLSAEKLLQNIDNIAASAELQQLPQQMQASLQELQRMLAGLSPGSAAYDKVNSNLQALEQVLREFQPVLKTLNQKSNALIFNATTEPDPEPKKAKQ